MGLSRRLFLQGGVALAAAPAAGTRAAEPARIKHVIYCTLDSSDPKQDELGRKDLSRLLAPHGLAEGRDFDVAFVRAAQPVHETWDDLLREPARAVVARRPDIIIVHMVWLTQMRAATSEIPIIFESALDLEEHAGVRDQRRPGTNVTGVISPFFEGIGKRIELLKEMRPSAKRAAVVHDDAGPALNRGCASAIAAAGKRLGLEHAQIVLPPGGHPQLVKMVRDRRIDLADFLMDPSPPQLAELAAAGVATSIASSARVVREGGLLSYGPVDGEQVFAGILARVLRGEHPSTIPAQQPGKYRLFLNMRTARALGIEVPPAIQLRAVVVAK